MRTWPVKRLALLVPAILAGSVLSACGSGSSADLTIYSGQHPQLTAKLVAAFERETGLEVAVRQSSEGVLPSQLAAEGERTPADVVITENASPMNAMADRGLLATLPKANVEAVVPEARGPKDRWVGVSRRVNVVAYNTKLLSADQLPSSLEDLAGPAFSGKLGLAPSEPDFTPVVSAFLKVNGERQTTTWLEGLKANAGPRSYADNEELMRRMGLGEVAVATLDQYYWYRYRHDGGSKDVAMAAFAPGPIGNLVGVSPVGITRNATHADAARRFVAFVTSAKGQEVVARSGAFEYPTRPGAPTPAGLPPISSYGTSSVTPAELGTGAAALRLMTQVQLL